VQFRQVELRCLAATFVTTATAVSQLDCSNFSTFVWVEPILTTTQFLASIGRLTFVEAV
jgi:hypothetical protein